MTSASLTYFDRIYVVNLPNRHDRRKEMAEQLGGVGLALDTDPVQLFAAVRPDSAGPFPTLGARGCFMSHLGVLLDAQRAGYGRIAILEDDVDFISSFEAEFSKVVERLQKEPWDVFYGGHRIVGWPPQAPADAVVETVSSEVAIVTAHFVAFSGKAIGEAASFLERLLERPPGDPAGGPMHVDGAYSWYRREHSSRLTRVSARQLAVQRPSRTDIHDLKWFDRWIVARDLAQAVRRLRKRT